MFTLLYICIVLCCVSQLREGSTYAWHQTKYRYSKNYLAVQLEGGTGSLLVKAWAPNSEVAGSSLTQASVAIFSPKLCLPHQRWS